MARHQPSICVTFCLVSLAVAASQNSSTLRSADRFGPETKLVDDLLHGYHNMARPIYDALQPVNVSIEMFSLVQLENLDERNQVLSLFAWMGFSWRDEYMVWDPDDYGGVQRVILDARRVWKPDIVIVNSADDVYSELTSTDFKVLMDYNGSAVWYTAGKTSVNCPLVLTRFPFDVQTCQVKLESWTYNGKEMSLWSRASTVDMDLYVEHGQWDITGTSITTSSVIYPGTLFPIPFYSMDISLTLKRKPLFYLMNVMLPCMMLSLLVVLVFYMPANSGEKVSLGITVLLSFSVFQLLVAGVMPETSDNTPAISMYLVCVMSLSALSILCTLIVLSVHHSDSPKRPPLWMRRLAFGCLSQLLLMSRETSSTTSGDDNNHPDEHNPHDSDGHHSNPMSNRVAVTQSSQSLSGSLRSRESKQEHGPVGVHSQDVNTRLLFDIKHELSTLTQKLKTDMASSTVKAEWVTMAKILDRLFLLLFLLAAVLLCSVMLGIVSSV